ncbi:drug resistance MFS transporter, drug:H+ antiporter-2 family [Clostridiales bacterium oral taxon 876 str. F0540]|nr:drug resistance MFS transporter, drug:H+ antiporter-2 family [Clostridiales bacterium oral taxon 876 str. F0540]
MIYAEKQQAQNRWLILAVVLIGPFMSTLDSSIVNVALPTIAKQLGVGVSAIQWVVTSYLIVISSMILIFGRIADLKGKKLVYQYGFLIFSIGSLFCGISKSISTLIISRIIQAIGASMTMSCSQAIITSVFPQNERGRALGLSGTTVALGTMVGPPLGGIMVGLFNWESIFLINVPIGIVAFLSGIKLLPKDSKGMNENFDFLGAIFFSVTIVSLFWAMLRGEELGWKNIYILIGFAAAAISLIIFYFWEKRAKHPMLEFSLFHNKLFTISILCAFISFLTIFCTNIIHPFYLQNALKTNAQVAGMLMMVYPITVALVAPLSGYLSDIIGSEVLTLLGLGLTALGLLLLSFLNIHSSFLSIILRMSVLGMGNGLFQSPNNSLVMSTAPKNKLGIAASINALIRNLGMVFGIAFSLTLLYNRMSAKIGYTVVSFVEGREDVFVYAMKFVYRTAASICILGIILTLFRLIKRKEKIS